MSKLLAHPCFLMDLLLQRDGKVISRGLAIDRLGEERGSGGEAQHLSDGPEK